MKSLWPIFKTEMSIYQSKAKLDVKSLFCKFTLHLAPEIRKMHVRGLDGNEDSTFDSGP